MKFAKKKRIVNKQLLESYRHLDCVINSRECQGQVCAHHIKTRGAGGDDSRENLIPLCIRHHSDIHRVGLASMSRDYEALSLYLELLSVMQ